MTAEDYGIIEGESVFIGLGSNLGDTEQNIKDAITRISFLPGVDIRKRSSIYLTEPVEVSNQPWFNNAVIEIFSIMEPEELLDKLQEIERDMGRETSGDDLPRVIDLDILFFGPRTIETERLTVPHPRLCNRRFVLEPLVEIAPDLVHPVWGGTMREWLDKLHGGGGVVKRG